LLSNHDLWEILRGLPVHQRVEVLGPPPAYEGLFPLGKVLPATIQTRLKNGRFVLVQDIMSPINLKDALEAIRPAKPLGPPLFVRPGTGPDEWQLAADYQRALIDEAKVVDPMASL